MPVVPGQVVVQLRVTLEDVRPVIWRRVLAPGGVRLPQFHRMLQVAMGWTDSHLHQFRIGDRLWGMHFEDRPEHELDEATVTVTGVIRGVHRFFYDYDFGDGWTHEVVVEDIARFDRGLKHAVCLDGQRACPPEDVGGPNGYDELLRVLADPADEDFDHYMGWTGGGFDPESFSVAATNVALQQLGPRRGRG